MYQFTGGSTAQAHNVVYTVLTGVIFVAVLPFAVLALMKNRYDQDQARKFVPWLKASFLVFTLTLALFFIFGVLSTVLIYRVTRDDNVARAANNIQYLAELFKTVSAALVMVFLLLLGPGMHYAIEGVTSKFDKVIRYTAYATAGVVIALSIATYGLYVDFHVNYTNRIVRITEAGGIERLQEIRKITATTYIILFVASLVITSLSIYTFIERRRSPLKTASTLYLAASLLNLLSSTWGFAFAVKWLLMEEVLGGERDRYVLILSIILGWWSRGILLIISFFVAKRSGSSGGVWSRTGKYGSVDTENGPSRNGRRA